MKVVLVITNLPDHASAVRLGEVLIGAKTAACVNVLAPCHSIYRWRGKTEVSEEVPLFVKTTEDRYSEVERIILEHHTYELPEIICVPVNSGLPAYLDWVAAETR